MLESIISSFSLVALSEMGDKTQLLAFSLAARYQRPWPIMGGILVATLLNHGLAATFGGYVAALVSPRVLGIALGLIFIGFGIWTLKPDTYEESGKPPRFGPFVTTLILFFLAEMGDKTQLATVALGAEFQSVYMVTLGTTLGMMVTDGLAVFLGEKLTQKISMRWIRLTAAALFVLFGGLSIVKVL